MNKRESFSLIPPTNASKELDKAKCGDPWANRLKYYLQTF